MMRYVYMALIVVLAGIVILFKVQNFDSATVTLFSMNFTMPVSVLVFAIYVLGMFTGGFMLLASLMVLVFALDIWRLKH